MKIYHITPKSNLPSILKHGLDPALARGKRKSVWGVVGTRVEWALVHVLAKPWNQNITLADLVVIEITLPKKNLRRYKTAIWYTTEAVKTVSVTKKMVMNSTQFGKVK